MGGNLRRLHEIIEQHAPWLKMSCTEFAYGGDQDVADAVLTLDALAVYAREGVDLATRWTAPTLGSITAYAYSLLNNYDQNGGSIAGLHYLNATSSEPLLGAHAFGDKDGKTKAVLLICRQHEGSLVASVNLGSSSSTVKLYRLDSDHAAPAKPETLSSTKGVVSVK